MSRFEIGPNHLMLKYRRLNPGMAGSLDFRILIKNQIHGRV